MGYSTGAAVADIIDNSIAAGASRVDIQFSWEGAASRVAILDDGKGLGDAELESAMTLGDKSPLDVRSPDDLGRFGMGLKTASLSQCRRMTVASIRGGSRSCLRWDLDELARNPDLGWALMEGPASGSEAYIEALFGRSHGSLVLWESMDRIVTKAFSPEHFLDLVDEVERHLAMVFHRIICGPRPRLRLTINGRDIVAWDPFMLGHAAKPWESPVARIATDAGPISVQGHVLPHKDRLSTAEFERDGGPAGWSAQQGFYVYRNERLLVAGGWLGLGQGRAWNREEAYRLARVQLDISNTADTAWKIDIRKSTARPPVNLRSWLTRLAEDTRNRARRVFAYRAAPQTKSGSSTIELAWRAEHTQAGVKYRIDEKHPAVTAVFDACGNHVDLVRALLRIIEETVPVQRIWLDTAEAKDTPRGGFAGEPNAEVQSVLMVLFKDMVVRRGMSEDLARAALAATEPFHAYPNLVAALRNTN
ncbi:MULTISPECIES: ATP-binding protein [Paraburkholderia]|uniref:ATP-binding protein n=1 Tax=Paraburkholderia TaxID=1822464 RepID=UPI00224D8E97|nr:MULTISPECIES: ATP-binding protein [Paraburkholderia]MCX4177498.1 ATP-binding protein [Paraburkholderia madseniana]MDQ6465487.1 ATP-binding protein [Paraburkholderia madseniana]